MERIINAFGKLFSLPVGSVLSVSKDGMTTTETDPQSTFTQLNIVSKGDIFYIVGNDFYKDLYNGKSSVFGNVNCDGIAMIKYDEQPFVLLVELKSNVDTNKISEAFQQEVLSFLKLTTVLGICDGYNISDFEIRGVIACHPFKSEDDYTHCLQNLMWEKEMGKKEARFKYRMIKEKRITSNIENCKWFIPVEAFPADIRNHKFTVSLIYGEKYEDSFLSIPLKAVI